MGETYVVPIFRNQTLTAGGNASKKINLNHYKPDSDSVTFQIHVAGTGTVTLTAKFSHDDDQYNDISGKTSIVTDQAAGNVSVEFTLPTAPYMEITATESGGTNPITDLDVTMAVK